MSDIGQAYVQILPSTKGMTSALEQELGGAAESAGKSAGLKIGDTIKKMVVGAGIGTAIKSALDEGAKLQQSYGGLETIYGEAAAAAKEYAAQAAQAGISANNYAETAVSFGASLKQAFGGDTTKAVEAANTAIMDMTDNAAKMGTPIESVQAAYQGFAKGQYQLLDNLKLGYGGTKTEMERLLSDAQKLTGVEYNIDNLGDVYDAIHVIQGDLGLTGVAAQEAASTFSGSFGSMKAAAQNLLGSLALGESITPALQTLATSTYNFVVNNLFPMVGNLLSGLGPLLAQGLTTAFNSIPNLIGIVTGFLTNITTAIQSDSGVLTDGLKTVATAALNAFKNTDWIGLGKAVIKLLTTGIGAVGSLVWTGLKTLGTKAFEMFKNVNWLQLGRTIITFIVNGIRALGGNIGTLLRSLGTKAFTLFRSIDWAGVGRSVISFIIRGISAIGSSIGSKLRQLGQTALGKFKSVNWAGVGRDIINGIISGISGAAGRLFGKLRNLASDALSAAKEKFKIGSPSKLFRDEVGRWIPAGIAEGVERGRGVLQDAMGGIALDSVNAFDSGAAYSAGTSIGKAVNSPIIYNNFTINAPAGMDIRALADAVADRISLAERQYSAVWS